MSWAHHDRDIPSEWKKPRRQLRSGIEIDSLTERRQHRLHRRLTSRSELQQSILAQLFQQSPPIRQKSFEGKRIRSRKPLLQFLPAMPEGFHGKTRFTE